MKINQSEWCMQISKIQSEAAKFFFVSYLIRELSWVKIQKEGKEWIELKSEVSTVDV